MNTISRRDFLATAAGAASLAMARQDDFKIPPIGVFSEVCDDLGLALEETAAAVAEAGLDGVDCPVRPGAKVLPERVEEDLPRLAEALKKHGRKVLLLTTAIRDTASPHVEKILRVAKRLEVTHYRLGYWKYAPKEDPRKQLEAIKTQLKDLAALNKDVGICAIFQNHSGGGCVGAKLDDLHEIVRGFDPGQIAVAFDVAHAVRELGAAWPERYEKLRSHFKVMYVKDVDRGGKWVRFGEGEVARTEFFQRFRNTGITAPLSMHHEYAWPGKDYPRTRNGLVKSLQGDLQTLRKWLGVPGK